GRGPVAGPSPGPPATKRAALVGHQPYARRHLHPLAKRRIAVYRRVSPITVGLGLLMPWIAFAQPGQAPPANQKKLQKQEQLRLEQPQTTEKAEAHAEQDRSSQVLAQDVLRLTSEHKEKVSELRMNEDIEVMRRILEGSFRRLWQP